jgi:hypothetical protein
MLVSSLLPTNMAPDYFKGTHLPTNVFSGRFQKASQPDSWTQPQLVGVDFRTQSETGSTTLIGRQRPIRAPRLHSSRVHALAGASQGPGPGAAIGHALRRTSGLDKQGL